MKRFLVLSMMVFAVVSMPAQARKPCEELGQEIAAKLDAKGVKNYTLEIVKADAVGDATVVGSCDGGTQRITYARGRAKPETIAQSEPAAPR